MCALYRGVGGSGDATNDANNEATVAVNAAAAAQSSATSASNSATSAATSATNAANSATSASSSATSASTQATNAATSASTATTQATNAAASASTATSAAASATTSATNAANSATSAATQATNAASSASTATTQATNAADSATAANAAKVAAEAARDSALSAYDNFDDRYLGPKTSDPTLDNDGNALLSGALYFNTVDLLMKVYTGTSWVAAYVSGSGAGFLVAANNLGDLTSVSSARTNLGLGTAATTASTDYATAAHNHAGVYEPADATILKDADIGVSVQAHNANTIAVAPGTSGNILTSNGTAWTSSAPSSTFNPASPGPIGGTTPSTGAFTTLTTSGNTLIGTSAQHGGASARAYISQSADTNAWKGLIVESADTKYWCGGIGIDSTGALNISQSYNGVGGSYQPIKFNVYGTNAATLDSSGLTTTGTINGLTVGKGGGAVSTNTAVGYQTLNANSTGGYTTAVGYQAGLNATNTLNNFGSTFVGYYSGYASTTGTDNCFLGSWSGKATTTGSANVAIGAGSLAANTTASNNTAVGYQALYAANGIADTLTFVGSQAGYQITTGQYSAGVGYQVLPALTTGGAVVALGYQAGKVLSTGSGGVYIGHNCSASSSSAGNEIVIASANQGAGKGSNTAFINANGGSTYNGANTTTWATTSDRRIKENIADLAPALDKILALRTVEFDYKESGKHEIGFIAQEFEEVFPDQIIHHAPSEAEKEWVGDDQVKAIQQNLVPYLVKAIQELSAKNEALEARLAALEAK